MNRGFEPIAECHAVDAATFRERIFPDNQPTVLRGVVRQWPAVRRGSASPQAMCDYLLGLRQGAPVPLLTADPTIQGRFFFGEDMQPNFQRRAAPLATGLRALLSHLDEAEPPAIFVESASLADCLPDFAASNALDLLDQSIAPRIWIGNAVKVQTHYDFSNNIACVLAGRRRVTLFPPDQLPNLYPAPMDITLAGVPVSMVPLHNPDLARYPRFQQALATAQATELEPGDGLFIPFGWWHHVESLQPFNVLVNYWWSDGRPFSSPIDCLLHGLLALRDLPQPERALWRNLFDYYVFQTSGDPFAHMPPSARGLMDAHSPQQLGEIRAILVRSLSTGS
jgi:hypothetical protein